MAAAATLARSGKREKGTTTTRPGLTARGEATGASAHKLAVVRDDDKGRGSQR